MIITSMFHVMGNTILNGQYWSSILLSKKQNIENDNQSFKCYNRHHNIIRSIFHAVHYKDYILYYKIISVLKWV